MEEGEFKKLFDDDDVPDRVPAFVANAGVSQSYGRPPDAYICRDDEGCEITLHCPRQQIQADDERLYCVSIITAEWRMLRTGRLPSYHTMTYWLPDKTSPELRRVSNCDGPPLALQPRLSREIADYAIETRCQYVAIFQSQNGSITPEKDGTYRAKIRGQEAQTFPTQEEAQQYLDRNKTPVDPKNAEERWFRPAVERVLEKADKELDEETRKAFAGLTLHHLRHTFGSWKIAQGEDVVYVSRQMGHSKPSVTYNVYAHLIDKRRPPPRF